MRKMCPRLGPNAYLLHRSSTHAGGGTRGANHALVGLPHALPSLLVRLGVVARLAEAAKAVSGLQTPLSFGSLRLSPTEPRLLMVAPQPKRRGGTYWPVHVLDNRTQRTTAAWNTPWAHVHILA